MNESSNEPPNKSKVSRSTNAQMEGSKSPNDKNAKGTISKPINVDSILKIATHAQEIDDSVAELIFERIDESKDDVILLYRLLKNFLTGTNPDEWLLLKQQDLPRRLLTKLCLTVEVDDLSSAWKNAEEGELAEIQKLVRNFTPIEYETAQSFLRGRKMLPLALIVFRHFRNDPVEMEDILSQWLLGIAAACRKRKLDPCEEAQRTAKWLIELAAKKSNPSAFLDAISAVTLPLRALEKAKKEKEIVTETQADLSDELTKTNTILEKSKRNVSDLENQLKKTSTQLTEACQKLKKLEGQLAFGGARAGVSEEQAIGELKQRLKQSVSAKAEDIKLFLDREKPNIQASLNLLSEIERQFD